MIKVRLVGERIDIEDIQYLLPLGSWAIVNEADGYYFRNSSVLMKDECEAAYGEANSLIDAMNGVANIFYRNHKRVGCDGYVYVDKNAKSHYLMKAEPIVFRTRTRGKISDKSDKILPTVIAEDLLNKSAKHRVILDALHFFVEINWWNLYKVYEIINSDLNNGIVTLATGRKIERFKSTANNRTALGDAARHWKFQDKLPKPMTLDEAYSLMKSVFEKWVKMKTTN